MKARFVMAFLASIFAVASCEVNEKETASRPSHALTSSAAITEETGLTAGCQESISSPSRRISEVDLSGDLIVGPMIWYGLGKYRPEKWRSLDEPRDGKYEVIKNPVGILSPVSVKLSVPSTEKSNIGLMYVRERSKVGYFYPEELDDMVVFQPCPRTEDEKNLWPPHGFPTNWAGGFVVAGRRCVSLRIEPSGGEPVTARLPLGVESCSQ